MLIRSEGVNGCYRHLRSWLCNHQPTGDCERWHPKHRASAILEYETIGQEKRSDKGHYDWISGVDLAIRDIMRLYEPTIRATGGPSSLRTDPGGEKSHHLYRSALLGETVKAMDGSDAKSS